MFALLGPNGSGKSTLMRTTLATLPGAGQGEARLDAAGGTIDLFADHDPLNKLIDRTPNDNVTDVAMPGG